VFFIIEYALDFFCGEPGPLGINFHAELGLQPLLMNFFLGVWGLKDLDLQLGLVGVESNIKIFDLSCFHWFSLP